MACGGMLVVGDSCLGPVGEQSLMNSRAFTVKSMIFGLIGVLIVCVLPVYSGKVLKLGNAIKGYLPVVPLFLIVLLSFVWNAVAGRFNRRLALSAGELAVVFGLMMMVSWLPKLQENVVRQLVLPRYEELTTNTTWQEAGVTTRLPDRLFPRGEAGEAIGDKTHSGMIQGGMARDQVPYEAWMGPLLNWMPFVVVLVLCLLALTFMVHRQWTRHEQLQYPLAAVVDSLIQQDPRKPGGAIFRNRLFWFGFAFVFGFHLLRYLHDWFPTHLPSPPVEYSLGWSNLFPSMLASNANYFLLEWMPFSFGLIAIAFLVPTDVSLAMGLTAPLGTLAGIQYYFLTGNPVSSGDLDVFRAGGFIAFGLILAYTGRAYYFPILLKALWPGRGGAQVDPGGVWAARVFLAAYVSLTLIVASMGVDLLMAGIIVTFVLLTFLVVTRLVCETGVPLIVAGWSLPTVLSGLLGPACIGAAPLMFMTFLGSTIASPGSTQLIMPYMATSLKIMDDNGVNLRRFALASKVAIAVALVAGFVAVLTLAYSEGEGTLGGGERGAWSQAVSQVLTMKDFGQYEASEAAHGVSRLALIRPDGDTVGLVLTGLVVVIACYLLRFRFAKWPLHPLFFVVLGTGCSRYAWLSFLLGWVIKTLIVKVGGGGVYRTVKPLFIGFIMGEFMIIALMLVVGMIYHAITGNNPISTWIL